MTSDFDIVLFREGVSHPHILHEWNEEDLKDLSSLSVSSTTQKSELVRGGLTKEHLRSITSRQWKAVLSWAAFHPDEVSALVDRHGQTALHYACLFRAPATVVEALLYAAPEIASIENDDGELAIHWSVRLSAPNEVLALLLHAHPRSAFVLDSIGQTPVSLLFDRHKKSLKQIFRDSGPEKTTSSHQWKQLMVFIRSYCSATSSEYNGSEFRPLHSVAACPCSLSIFQFILNVCKGDVRKRDEFGRLPLSILASSRCTNGFSGEKKMKELLECYPEAAGQTDGRGRLPINLAIEAGKSWEGGIELLFKAEPRALSSRDSRTRFYPFLLAAAKRLHTIQRGDIGGYLLNDLNTIFCLIREDPSLLMPM